MKDIYRTFGEFLEDSLRENVKDEGTKSKVRNILTKYGIDDLDKFAALTVQDALEWGNFGKVGVTALISMGVTTQERDPEAVATIIDVDHIMEQNARLRLLAFKMYHMLDDNGQVLFADDISSFGIDVGRDDG